MSKSEWKELPEWTKPEEYAFLEGATPQVWAWEFLRRNAEYREDWKRYAENKASFYYCPPKNDHENDKRWMARVVSTSNADPVKTRMDLHIANKWSLGQLHRPDLPYTPAIHFMK